MDGYVVEFFPTNKEPEPIDMSSNNVANADTDKIIEKICEFISENPNITLNELADKIGVTKRTIERNIQKLQNEGIIERIGSRKNGIWKIKSLIMSV